MNLKAQKLVRQRPVTLGKGEGNFSVLVLTKEGKFLAERQGDHSSQQQFCAGFVKSQEVAHDATLYLMYQAQAAQIEKRGGTVRRVVLDYELKITSTRPSVKRGSCHLSSTPSAKPKAPPRTA